MGDLQQRIMSALEAHDRGLCLAILRDKLSRPKHLPRALAGLEAIGAVRIIERSTAWASGPIVVLLPARTANLSELPGRDRARPPEKVSSERQQRSGGEGQGSSADRGNYRAGATRGTHARAEYPSYYAWRCNDV
jgi:hypothetical protein